MQREGLVANARMGQGQLDGMARVKRLYGCGLLCGRPEQLRSKQGCCNNSHQAASAHIFSSQMMREG